MRYKKMSMRQPAPFRVAIAALNREWEFDPNAPARMLVTDGNQFRFTQPYWIQLRDEAHVIRQMLLKERPDSAASDEEYRKAQDVFVETLLGLVENWSRSDWSLAAAFSQYPEMKRQIEGFLRRNPLAIMPASRGPSFVAAPFGQGAIKRIPREKDKPVDRACGEAIACFIELVRHPECERLGKCQRCGRYFYGHRGQKCCPRPRRCGSYRAAIEATKRKWRDERQRKLDRAKTEGAEWMRKKPSLDWKLWVADRIGVTPKWVTRAVNSGELTPPGEHRREIGAQSTKSSLGKNQLKTEENR